MVLVALMVMGVGLTATLVRTAAVCATGLYVGLRCEGVGLYWKGGASGLNWTLEVVGVGWRLAMLEP